MHPPKNSWSNTDGSRGVLMVAQLMSEMLNSATFESFRVYTLGTIARLNEAIEIIGDISVDRLPRQAIEPIIDELLWSLAQDPVTTTLVGNKIEILKATIKPQNYSLISVKSQLIFMRKQIEQKYKKALEAKVLELFCDSKNRVALRKACGFYCSHLVNVGYAKPHIASIVKEEFFSRDMRRCGKATLSKFFRAFDGRHRAYILHVGLSHEFGLYLRSLGFEVVNTEDLSTNIQEVICYAGNPASYSKVLRREITRTDPYSAMLAMAQLLTSIRAITYLDPREMNFVWSDYMYVSQKRSRNGGMIQKIEIPFQKPNQTSQAGRQLKRISTYTKNLLTNFDLPSSERLLSSINTAALARASTNAENQLISLWSSIEVLLSEPPSGTARIVHYCDLILPCIAIKHIRRQIIAVYNDLLRSYRRSFREILYKETMFRDVDHHTSFAAIMLLPEYESLRNDLCQLCAKTPALYIVYGK